MYDEFIKNFDMSIDEEDIIKMKEKKAIGLLEALNNLEKKCKIEKVPYNSKIKKMAISLLPEDYGTFETILNLIKKLQNENNELKADLPEMIISNEHKKKEWVAKDVLNNYISKQQVKDLILNKKEEMIKNNNEIEECRKTILEEQTLKQLRLMILHRKNEILFEQIAVLQELLHY